MSTVILTVACPEAARPDATHMGIVHGWLQGQTPAEWQGAFSAQYQDSQGNLYRVFSLPVGQAAIDGMLQLLQLADLQRPPMDVPDENGDYLINMAAVNRAHDMLRGNVWMPATPDPETGEMPDNPVPQIDGTKIVAVVGMKGTDALAAMGLQAIPMEL
jgi:hypothetical protein